MNNTFSHLFRKPKNSLVLAHLRERLLKIMLFSSFVVGTPLLGFALIPVLQRSLYPAILFYSLLYVWIILLAFVFRLSYRVRAIGWLSLFYAMGAYNLLTSGFNVDAGLLFITFIAMAILLMDLPGGLVAIGLSSISVSILGFLNTDQDFPLPLGLSQSEPMLWIIGGTIFLLMGVLLIYSLTVVVTGLEDNLAKSMSLADELERTNQSLRMSEARYRTLVETSPGLVAMLDLNGNILMVNQFGLALFGYEHPADITGKNLLDFISPDNQARVTDALQKTIETGGLKDFTFPVHRKDGSAFLGEFSSALVLDEAGQPQAVIGVGRDVTEREEAGKLIQEAKDALVEKVALTAGRLDELVKHGPTVIYSTRISDHAITYISENALAIAGYDAASILEDGSFWRNHIHPEDQGAVLAQLDDPKYKERAVSELRFLKKDGSYCWLRTDRMLLRDAQGNPLEYIGSIADITESKKTEQTLKASEARYRSLYEGMMDAFVCVEMDGRIKQFNQAYQEMLGYPSQELYKLTYIDITPAKWHDFESRIVEKQLFSQGYSAVYEKEYIRKDGTVFPVELRTVLIRDEKGNPSEMWAIVRDISERKSIEQALVESEARNRYLLDNSLQGVFVFQDLRILYANQAVTDSFGYTRDELLSFTPAGIILHIYPDDRPMVQKRWQRPPESLPAAERYPLRVIHKNGKICWLEARTVPIQFEGKPALLTTTIDVTDIRRIEAELQESERTQRTILDSADALVFLADTNGVIISANEKAVRHLGKGTGITAGTVVHEIFPDDDLARARRNYYNQVVRSAKPVTFEDFRAGAWFENSFYPILDDAGKVVRIAAFIRDITGRKLGEAEVEKNAKILQTILDASDASVLLVDTQGILLASNNRFAERLGRKPESILGTSIFEIMSGEIALARKAAFGQIISSRQSATFVASNKDTWYEDSLYPILDASGKVTSVAIYARDITEQRRVSQALLASEEQYRKLAEAAPDMIFIIGRDDRIQYVNSFGAKFLGAEPRELVGQPRALFFPLDTNEHQYGSIRQVLRTGEAVSAESVNVFQTQAIWLNTWLVPLKDAAGEVTSVLGVSRDITARKQIEEELRQARDFLEARVAERTNELEASRKKLRALTAETVNAQEAERRFLSRELHDEAGQALITIKYSLAAMESDLPKTEKQFRQRLVDAMAIIDQTNAHIRSMAHNLRPPVLEIGGIDLGLQDYCQEQSERTRIPILYRGQEIPGLPDEIGISLYRFVQEALTNILKHARASQVKVVLRYKKGEILVSVADNGRGIEDAARTDGEGLLGIRERLALLGGRLEIHSRTGRGAKLVACIPWSRPT